MNLKIEKLITEFVRNHVARGLPQPFWRDPVVCFGDAKDPFFEKLKDKEVVHPLHLMPEEQLEDAKSVISYFIPFDKEVIRSNVGNFQLPSEEWGIGKPETNFLIDLINEEVQEFAMGIGFDSSLIPATYDFTKDCKSTWSHKHVSYICGLGTFGVNNLLITEKGCCGRIGTIVTSIEGIEPTVREEGKENCIYKRNKNKEEEGGESKRNFECLECVKACENNCLSENYDDFKRFKCLFWIFNNKRKIGYDVCGKCSVGLPCSYKSP